MKITEHHSNGASITVQGIGARRVIEAWRAAQSPKPKPEPEPEQPKVVGTNASTERASTDLYPTMNGSGRWTSTIFGVFTPNDPITAPTKGAQ